MSTIITPLEFIHSRLGNIARAPSCTGQGWYTIQSQPGGQWSAENSRMGFIGLYKTEHECVLACGAIDINASVSWLKLLP